MLVGVCVVRVLMNLCVIMCVEINNVWSDNFVFGVDYFIGCFLDIVVDVFDDFIFDGYVVYKLGNLCVVNNCFVFN